MGWVLNATPLLLYPWEREAGSVWMGAGKLAPTGTRSPDRPARSELLYPLSYRGPRFYKSFPIYTTSNSLHTYHEASLCHFVLR